MKTQFAVCVKNDDNPVSLELRKIYRIIPDESAAERNLVRVIDESGEDYIYPSDYFVPIDLPPALKEIFDPKKQPDFIQ